MKKENKFYSILNKLNWAYLILFIFFSIFSLLLFLIGKIFGCSLINDYDFFYSCQNKNLESVFLNIFYPLSYIFSFIFFYSTIALIISTVSFFIDYKKLKEKNFSFKILFKKSYFYSFLISFVFVFLIIRIFYVQFLVL